MDRKLSARRIETASRASLQVQGLSQVYLKVAVQAGHSLAAVHVDSRHPFSKEAARSADDGRLDGCDGGAAGDVLASSVDQSNSFWPRKLSAAPIGFSSNAKRSSKRL